MIESNLNEKCIRTKLQQFYDNSAQCGLEASVVKKASPKLKRMSLSEKENKKGKNFRTVLKEMFFEVIQEKYISQDAEYEDGHKLADNQRKILIFEQEDNFCPFTYLSDSGEIDEFVPEDLTDAVGLVFRFRKGNEMFWIYQHLWSIMVPNKKKTNFVARLMQFENQTVFEEQRESLLTIARRVDILIMNPFLITDNINLLQKYFGFQNYIYQSAQHTIQYIIQKNIVENTEKLSDYIDRGKLKYAKKMMRIGTSKVFDLTQEQLVNKVNTLPRWRDKFNFNQDSRKIVLNTYGEVENLIDLFDERYTRSDVTDTEYDTDVKRVAQSVE